MKFVKLTRYYTQDGDDAIYVNLDCCEGMSAFEQESRTGTQLTFSNGIIYATESPEQILELLNG